MQSVRSPSTPCRSTHSTGEHRGPGGSGIPRSCPCIGERHQYPAGAAPIPRVIQPDARRAEGPPPWPRWRRRRRAARSRCTARGARRRSGPGRPPTGPPPPPVPADRRAIPAPATDAARRPPGTRRPTHPARQAPGSPHPESPVSPTVVTPPDQHSAMPTPRPRRRSRPRSRVSFTRANPNDPGSGNPSQGGAPRSNPVNSR